MSTSSGTDRTRRGAPALDEDRVVYSLCVSDLQHVAVEKLSRRLRASELRSVEDKLGDYVDWYGAIDAAISEAVK